MSENNNNFNYGENNQSPQDAQFQYAPDQQNEQAFGQAAPQNDQFQYNQQNNAQYGTVAPAHGKAVAALVLSIVGLCCCGICSIIGLILSISAKNEGNDEGIRKAAFVISIIAIAVWIVGVIIGLVNGTLVNISY